MKYLFLFCALFLISACGPSQEEMDSIAKVTCNIIKETKADQGALRLQQINDARKQIGGVAFTSSDDFLVEATTYDLCESLVKNEKDFLAKMLGKRKFLKEQERQRTEKRSRCVENVIREIETGNQATEDPFCEKWFAESSEVVKNPIKSLDEMIQFLNRNPPSAEIEQRFKLSQYEFEDSFEINLRGASKILRTKLLISTYFDQETMFGKEGWIVRHLVPIRAAILQVLKSTSLETIQSPTGKTETLEQLRVSINDQLELYEKTTAQPIEQVEFSELTIR